MSPNRARTRTARSGDLSINDEATAPLTNDMTVKTRNLLNSVYTLALSQIHSNLALFLEPSAPQKIQYVIRQMEIIMGDVLSIVRKLEHHKLAQQETLEEK